MGFGEEDDYINAHLQPPSISNFQKTADVIISRQPSSQSKYRRSVQQSTSTMEKEMQTDTEMFFQYIFDFLGELERRINSGELSIEDILAMGRDALYRDRNEEAGDATKASRWNYDSPAKKKGGQGGGMYFSVQELKECLRRLKSLGAHGGDVFFAGIARTMAAKPHIPHSFNEQKSFKRDTSPLLSDDDTDYQANLQAVQMEELKKMTRVKRSVGGGSSFVREGGSTSFSPKKAAGGGAGAAFERASSILSQGGGGSSLLGPMAGLAEDRSPLLRKSMTK